VHDEKIWMPRTSIAWSICSTLLIPSKENGLAMARVCLKSESVSQGRGGDL